MGFAELAFGDVIHRRCGTILSCCSLLSCELTFGCSGLSTVYKGRFRGDDVCIKRFNGAMYDEAVDEFRSEVSVMRKVHHPRTVLFRGACSAKEEELCLVMELMFTSLYDWLHRRDRFPRPPPPPLSSDAGLRVMLRILLDAAQGIREIQSAGIVHRDLKSQKILLDSNKRAKV